MIISGLNLDLRGGLYFDKQKGLGTSSMNGNYGAHEDDDP